MGEINLWDNLDSLPYDRKEDLIALLVSNPLPKTLGSSFFPPKSLKRNTQCLHPCHFLVHKFMNISSLPFAVGVWASFNVIIHTILVTRDPTTVGNKRQLKFVWTRCLGHQEWASARSDISFLKPLRFWNQLLETEERQEISFLLSKLKAPFHSH